MYCWYTRPHAKFCQRNPRFCLQIWGGVSGNHACLERWWIRWTALETQRFGWRNTRKSWAKQTGHGCAKELLEEWGHGEGVGVQVKLPSWWILTLFYELHLLSTNTKTTRNLNLLYTSPPRTCSYCPNCVCMSLESPCPWAELGDVPIHEPPQGRKGAQPPVVLGQHCWGEPGHSWEESRGGQTVITPSGLFLGLSKVRLDIKQTIISSSPQCGLSSSVFNKSQFSPEAERTWVLCQVPSFQSIVISVNEAFSVSQVFASLLNT